MNKQDELSMIDSDALAFVCGGAASGGGGGGTNSEDQQPTPSDDKRSVNIGWSKDSGQFGIQISKETHFSDYALCLAKHPFSPDKCKQPAPTKTA